MDVGIYQTRKGYGVDWRDEWGRRHRRFVGSYQGAQVLHAQLRRSVAIARSNAAAQFLGTTPLTPDAAIDAFLARSNATPKTKANTRYTLAAFFRRANVGDIIQVTPRLLTTYRLERLQQISPPSVEKEAAAIARLFQFLEQTHEIPANPATGLPQRRYDNSPARAITHQEEKRLLDAATPRTRTRLLLALDAGLRRGETDDLRRNHIDFAKGNLIVHASKTQTTRQIPTTPRLARELLALSEHLDPDSYVCARGTIQKTSEGTMPFLRAKAKVNCRFHDLRHTFATRLAQAGVPHRIRRVLLGHGPRNPTELYDHPTEEELQEAILTLAEWNDKQIRDTQAAAERDTQK
jgi:integrase